MSARQFKSPHPVARPAVKQRSSQFKSPKIVVPEAQSEVLSRVEPQRPGSSQGATTQFKLPPREIIASPPPPIAINRAAAMHAPPMQEEEHASHSVPLVFRMFAICLAPIAVCINFSNYGTLIPQMQSVLHVSTAQVGLVSTLLFLGIALTNIPGGILSDRFGSRTTMLGSMTLVTLGGLLLPLVPNLFWMILCRLVIGLGSGIALVAGSHATAELDKQHTALGQGLNGGAAQLGGALGAFATSLLLVAFGWRNALLVDALPGVLVLIVWWWMPRAASHSHGPVERQDPAAGIRSPIIWTLGMANMGTFGLANMLVSWLTVYFLHRYGVPLALAAILGSLGLLGGVLFRPLGGILLARWQRPVLLIRLGTTLACVGVGLMALPFPLLPVSVLGLLLFAFGVTMPYSAIFSTAATVGKKTSIGSGVAQGLMALLASPAAIIGGPLIGFLADRTNNYAFTFGTIGLGVALVGCVASFALGPVLRQRKSQYELAA